MSLPIRSQPQAGVGTFSYTIDTAGVYTADITAYMQPGSGLIVVIKQNTTTLLTSPTPLAAQTRIDLVYSGILCAANDVISFVLTDTVLTEGVKSFINLYAGTL